MGRGPTPFIVPDGADGSWMDQAQCHGLGDVMFPEHGEDTPAGREAWDAARAVCRDCPVAQRCLDYAMTTRQDHGCWGATSPNDRRKLRIRGGDWPAVPAGQRDCARVGCNEAARRKGLCHTHYMQVHRAGGVAS